MSRRLKVSHRTTYTFDQPVHLGPHTLMVRARDSHDLRLVSAKLTVTPSTRTTWSYDTFSNSIALLAFDQESDVVDILSEIEVDQFASDDIEMPMASWASQLPFSYTPEDAFDLAPFLRRHYDDPDNEILVWARALVVGRDTIAALKALAGAIHRFEYRPRYVEGTQNPLDTLRTGAGTCRDFALLMIEAARTLGLAARFCSGYLYDPALDEGVSDGLRGAGSTHAWVQIFLPGAGWLEFDPTNNMFGGDRLIRVAVTRDPSQALPVSGSFSGPASVRSELTVDVRVTALPD